MKWLNQILFYKNEFLDPLIYLIFWTEDWFYKFKVINRTRLTWISLTLMNNLFLFCAWAKFWETELKLCKKQDAVQLKIHANFVDLWKRIIARVIKLSSIDTMPTGGTINSIKFISVGVLLRVNFKVWVMWLIYLPNLNG